MAGGHYSPFLKARRLSALLPGLIGTAGAACGEITDNDQEMISFFGRTPARPPPQMGQGHSGNGRSPSASGCQSDLHLGWEWQVSGNRDLRAALCPALSVPLDERGRALLPPALDHRQLLRDLGAQSRSNRLSLQARAGVEEPGPVGWLVHVDRVPQAARGERSPRMDAQAQGALAPACVG